jgi:MFS family permease
MIEISRSYHCSFSSFSLLLELPYLYTTFVRDRFTWLAYGMLAYFAYLQASLGPALPFLRQELNLSYTVAGFHASAMALGMILAGSFADRIARRWGRHLTFWGGGCGMALGAILIGVGTRPVLTIGGAGLMGAIGGLLLIMIQSTLADRYGPRRATALTEANLTASVGAMCVPLLMGLFQVSGIGWQTAMFVAALVWMAAFLRLYRVPIPNDFGREISTPGVQRLTTGAPLPVVYWVFWSVIFCVVAIEWCMAYWGAAFLEQSAGLGRAAASSVMSVFFAAVVAGRLLGSRLTHRFESTTLLLGSLGVAMLGFPLFWLASSVWLTLVGLVVTGFGIANLFPLTLSAATGVAPDQADRASARISLGAGVAILLAPQFLGTLADRIGVHGAYAVVPVLILCAIVATIIARRLQD